VRRLRRLLPAAAALAAAASIASGCEGNTCEYGSEGLGSSADCKGRPAPTEAEANGWREDSLRARIDKYEATAGPDPALTGVTVNHWGEMAFTSRAPGGDEEVTAFDVGGEPVEMEGIPASGDVAFAPGAIRAEALERVMNASAKLHPGLPFVEADLSYEAPRIEGGRDFSRRFLSWTVAVGEASEYVYYETDATGRILCERVGGAEECTEPR
jgi:hypothetical protein